MRISDTANGARKHEHAHTANMMPDIHSKQTRVIKEERERHLVA